MTRWLIIAVSIAFASACAQNPWVASARTGSLGEVQRYVEVAADRNQFDHSRTVELAEVVAEREIESADDPGAYDRLLALGPCVSEVFWSLKHRSKRNDDGAAAASSVLFEGGFTEGLRDVTTQKEDGAWRAFAVRLAVVREARKFVYAALRDPDVRVRRAAMRAVQQNPMPTDGKELLNVARLDPDSGLREAALTALGENGDMPTLLAAHDYWGDMVESTRLGFVQALNAPRTRTRGGEPLLLRILESNDSLEGAVAASLLFNDATTSRGYARARLLRALRNGSTSERLLALATLPPNDPEARFDIQTLANSNAPYLRTAALELYLKVNVSTELATERLRSIAASKDADAYEAAKILALHGDLNAISRIERQLGVAQSSERLAAARLLLKLKRWAGVARALTDDHPAVRLALACDIVTQ